MKSFEDINQVWTVAKLRAAPKKVLVNRNIEKFVRKYRRSLSYHLLGLIINLATVVLMLWAFDFKFWFTAVGLILIGIATISLTVYRLIQFIYFLKINKALQPKEYLGRLQNYQLNNTTRLIKIFRVFAITVFFGLLMMSYETLLVLPKPLWILPFTALLGTLIASVVNYSGAKVRNENAALFAIREQLNVLVNDDAVK